MGAYLNKPVIDKISNDEENEYLNVGTSSMQGWRVSQEDAHNCILNFDEKTSFFAVYDGHGGAEVATYCAENFPEFLKQLAVYKEGNYEQALKDAFLDFDKTLLQDDVLEILKRLAEERNPDREDSDSDEEEEVEDLVQLCEEGSLPLYQVLEKYKKAKSQDASSRGNEAVASSSGTSKSKTITVRSMPVRRNSICVRSFSNDDQTETDDVVSSSNVEHEENSARNTLIIEPTSDVEESSNKNRETCVSSDSPQISKDISIKNSENLKNGDIKSHDDSVGKNEGVSSTSSPCGSSRTQKFENGDVTCNSVKNYSENSMVGCQMDEDSSSEEDDTDFHAEENSSTEDGEEDCEPCDEETEEEIEDEEGVDDGFCANMMEEAGKDSGCTAVIALLHGRDLYVANAGDSRCVLCRGGTLIEMSLDHKPEDENEKERIYKAGGKVTMDGRVNGGLNLSRAIGDHAYKMNKDLSPEEQMISALPDVRKIVITPEDEFLILACDGIWNYMSSQEVVDFVKNKLNEGVEPLSKICEELFDTCLAPHTIGDGTGCDNMTAVIIKFKQPNILELPTKQSDENKSVKRTASSMSTNDNDENTNSLKRVKTEENKNANQTHDSLSSSDVSSPADVQISENISSTVTSTSTLPATQTVATSVSTNRNEQDSSVASTT